MPPKKKKQKLLILIRLSQLCLRSLTRIAQVNPFQRPRIPRPKIIPSRTRRLLKSHAGQILVSLAKKKSVLKWKSKDRRMYELKKKPEVNFKAYPLSLRLTSYIFLSVLNLISINSFFLNLCQTSTEAFIVVFLNFSFLL